MKGIKKANKLISIINIILILGLYIAYFLVLELIFKKIDTIITSKALKGLGIAISEIYLTKPLIVLSLFVLRRYKFIQHIDMDIVMRE